MLLLLRARQVPRQAAALPRACDRCLASPSTAWAAAAPPLRRGLHAVALSPWITVAAADATRQHQQRLWLRPRTRAAVPLLHRQLSSKAAAPDDGDESNSDWMDMSGSEEAVEYAEDSGLEVEYVEDSGAEDDAPTWVEVDEETLRRIEAGEPLGLDGDSSSGDEQFVSSDLPVEYAAEDEAVEASSDGESDSVHEEQTGGYGVDVGGGMMEWVFSEGESDDEAMGTWDGTGEEPEWMQDVVFAHGRGSDMFTSRDLELREEDLEERFTRASGKGGQKTNKTSSCVMLRHLPTDTRIKCQVTRSQKQNREIARKMMQNKLNELRLGRQSRRALQQAKTRKKKAKSKSRHRKKMEKLHAERAAAASGEAADGHATGGGEATAEVADSEQGAGGANEAASGSGSGDGAGK